MATDPVCGMQVDENRAEGKSEYQGKQYYFCSDECRKEFESRPEEFQKSQAA